jgi:hypothetical protein
MYMINVTSPAISMSSMTRTAPPAVSGTGANSALGTPAFAHVGIDARVRDAKQAAPPRGELR